MHNKNKKIPASSFKFSDLLTADYLIITAILVLLPLLVYGQVYNFEFVWDEISTPVNHLNNAFVESPSWANFGTLFTQPYFGMYIPVSYFTWGVLKFFTELLALKLSSVLHLTNVVLHIINGLLVFTLLKQFVSNKWAVLIGVLFFLLHPLQVEVVAWVSEFRTLLAFFFSLLALNLYLKNQAKPNFLSLLLFALALLSKPSAVVLPLIMVAINIFYYQFTLIASVKKTLPFFLLALVAAVIIINVQAATVPPSHIVDYAQRPFVWLDSIVFYLYKLVYPVNLSSVYGLSSTFVIHQLWFYPLAILPLGFLMWLWTKCKKKPLLLLAGVLFLIGFLPTSGLITFTFQIASFVADRYLYFSFIGIALFIAAILNTSNQQYLWAFFIGIFLIFTALSTFRQIPIWHNSVKLWTHSINVSFFDYYAKRELSRTFNNKGTAFARAGNIDSALTYFNKASVLEPNNGRTLNNVIQAYASLKQCKNAWQRAHFMQKIPLKIHPAILSQLEKECPSQP